MTPDDLSTYLTEQRNNFVLAYPEADEEIITAFCDLLESNYETDHDDWDISE